MHQKQGLQEKREVHEPEVQEKGIALV